MAVFSPEITTKKMVPVCRQLATTYRAGIPILQALDHVGSQTPDKKTKQVLLRMGEDIRNGSTLTEAANAQSKYLSPFFVHLLASGEKGGQLDTSLSDLATFFEDRLKMQRSIVGMLALPLFELTAAWFIGSFALGVFQGAMDSGGGTAGVMVYFREVYIPLQIKVMITFGIVAAVAIVISRLGWLGWITGTISTHLWPLKNVVLKLALARFYRSLGLLITSGLSMVKCIENAATVIGNPYIERDLLKAVPRLKNGATLSEAFGESRCITPLGREMINIGETAGSLDTQLKKASDIHMDEANHAVSVAVKALGAAIMLAVGALVGFIIIRAYSNIYGGIFDELGI